MEAEHTTEIGARLGPHLQTDYDEARVAELERAARERVERAAREARTRRVALAAALVALGLGAALALAWESSREAALPPRPVAVTIVTSASPERVELADGTLASVLDAGELSVAEATPERVELELVEGAARFDVARDEGRLFVVRAGDVEVTVLGTAFDVRVTPGGVDVEVIRGKVRVESPRRGERHTLERGQRVRVTSERSMLEAAELAQALAPMITRTARETTEAAPRAEEKAPRATPRWVQLARRGAHGEAARMLSRGARVEDRVEELILAADIMRTAGLHEDAVDYLDGVIARHRRDRRWTLAAFKKGRILLSSLNRPREAAETFARVAGSRKAQLSEDALAREVEAWSKAGERGKARERALEYMRRHPRGRRVDSVRRFGGLDAPTP